MSLTTGLIAVKGNHFDNLPQIFNFFKLRDTNNDEILENWNDVTCLIDREHLHRTDYSQKRVVWFDNGWTIIEDHSLVMCIDEKALSNLSQNFSTQVFSLVTQGTSGCYGFWYFNLQKIRSFFVQDCIVTDNFGKPLLQENGYNIDKDCTFDDVHGVAKLLGIDLSNAESINHFIVKQIEDKEVSGTQDYDTIIDSKRLPERIKSKPWWKFWLC